jgi:uncharacterized protein YqjF (DUF2071 family)
MGQSWLRLLFAHWPVEREELSHLLPAQLTVETFDGRAWLGITPFTLRGLNVIGVPPLPRLSTFPELNVRTYVTDGSKAGIWFFSLDAASGLAVAGARRFYHLPYYHARMQVRETGASTCFHSQRIGQPVSADFGLKYRPTSDAFQAGSGTLEHFLIERYCLYAQDPEGELQRAEIHHPPWSVRSARAEITTNSVTPPGINLATSAPLLHYADRQDVLIWPPRAVSR